MTTRTAPSNNSVVGVWEVQIPDAPFPWHVMTFTPYQTMSQSNPHDGNRDESDSSGQGIWETIKQADKTTKVRGKFVEFKADRTSGDYIGKGVITFEFVVTGDDFKGTCQVHRYDSAGRLVRESSPLALIGKRVRLED